MFAAPPEESQLCEDQVWKLLNALYGYRKAPKLFTSTNMFVALLSSLKFRPLLTDPSRSDELDIHNFIHVDCGLLFGPSIEHLRLF